MCIRDRGWESMKLYDEMRKTFDYDFEFSANENGDPIGFVYFCESEFEMEAAKRQVDANQKDVYKRQYAYCH